MVSAALRLSMNSPVILYFSTTFFSGSAGTMTPAQAWSREAEGSGVSSAGGAGRGQGGEAGLKGPWEAGGQALPQLLPR